MEASEHVGGDAPGDRWDVANQLIATTRDARGEDRSRALLALATSPGSWWAALDATLRSQSWHVQDYVPGLTDLVAEGRADLLELVVAGCHHNGRLRGAAVARLRAHDHPVADVLLALRSADWADPVRDAARAACERSLTPDIDPERLLVIADLADAIRDRVRARWLRERLDDLVTRLPDPALTRLLSDARPRVRRHAYRVALAAGRLPVDRLVAAALDDPDNVIRTVCANAAFAAAPDLSVARSLLAARLPLVRSEAVRLLARDGDLAVARAALADPAPVVRLVAQVAVGKAGDDPAACYRELLARAAPEPGAIAGLGETGTAADAELIAPRLAHPAARGRAAAVRALVALDAVRAEQLLPLLRDPSAAVVAQAASALCGVAHEISEPLHELLGAGHPVPVRRAAYRLLLVRDVWRGLAASLRLLATADPVLLAQARSEVDAWPRNPGPRAYRQLTPEVVAELRAAIEQARPVLGDSRAELLHWCLRQDR
ncbi:hypothetical protein ACFQY4_15935 [Catellatospora bangladeshensis]|uniref:HEAT repeat protein n=1 Tax=Catellatospora bangladeshensis TaxID=310355 RepID=A0A8J3NMU4_9ACTN|nr:hypothetical protein [Catellatospora bangladeshensis]GIF85586.1 hypothetical protein Cba03nite_69350 [Catellatospora bangladeshensis]